MSTAHADHPAHFPLIEPLESRTLLAGFSAQINFQPLDSPVPDGYIADVGTRFRRQNGLRYGWSKPNAKNAVDRDAKRSPDQRYDTANSLQLGKKGKVNLSWEIAVPNGLYHVHVVAGDPAQKGNRLRINAEETLIVDGRATKRRRWAEGSAVVNVTDGRLTISNATGAVRNRISFIEISQVRDGRQMIQAEDFDAASGVHSIDHIYADDQVVTSLSPGDVIRFENVLFDPSFRSVQMRLLVNDFNAGQTIELRLDRRNGPLLASLTTQGAGDLDAPSVQSAAINPVSGVHDLYIRFKGDADAGAIDWLRFSHRPFLRVMPLGDSITESRGGFDSYRHLLWHHFENNGYSVDYVGSRRGVRPDSGEPAFVDYDWDHEGHSGWRADQLRDNIFTWAAQHRPDVVLLQAGVNDLIAGQSVASTISEIEQIIERLRAANPNVTIFLSNLLPTTLVPAASIADINARIASLAQQLNTQRSRIILVDQFTGFNVDTETIDGLHPNLDGERRMADKWFQVIRSVL